MRAQALCICPTRELVVQNLNVLERMARFTSISATSTAATDSRFSRCAVVELAPRAQATVDVCWQKSP